MRRSVKGLRRQSIFSIDIEKLSKEKEFESLKKHVHQMLIQTIGTEETKYLNELKDEVVREFITQWINRNLSSRAIDNYIPNILESYLKVLANTSEATVREKAEFFDVCQYIKKNLLETYVKNKQNAANFLMHMLELGQYKNLRPILLDYIVSKLKVLHEQYDVLYDEIINILRNEKRNLFVNSEKNIRDALNKIIEQSSQSEAFKQFAIEAIENCVQLQLMMECFNSNIALFLEVVLEDYRNKKIIENSELGDAIKGFLTLICHKCYQTKIEEEIIHHMASAADHGKAMPRLRSPR